MKGVSPRKKCTGPCGRTLFRTTFFFNKSKSSRDGFCQRCKDCTSEAYYRDRDRIIAVVYKWQAKNKERLKLYTKRWAERHPERAKAARRAGANNRRARVMDAPGHFGIRQVRRLLKEQNNRCYWCGPPLTTYHIDHVIPLSKGGSNWASNLVCACPTCNLKKGSKMPAVFMRQLAKSKGSLQA